MTKLITAVLVFASVAFGQTAAALFPMPKFQPLDNDGLIVPGGTLCVYAAGTTTPLDSFTTSAGNVANTNPVILDSSGRANVWLKATAKIVFSQPGTGCPSTGVTIWTVDGITALTNTPTFTTVVATTFNSVATGSTNAFQSNTGTFTITGAGNAAFQSVAVNQGSYVGQAVAPTPPGAGYAFVYYDTVIGAIRYNLGGAGWSEIPQILSGVLTVGPVDTAGKGYVGTIYNSTATGVKSAFQTSSGSYVVTGAGNIAAQSIVVTNGITTGATHVGITSGTCSHWHLGICDTP